MTQHVQLNNVEHSSIKIRTERTTELGDGIMLAPVFPHEFRNVQANYPIVFIKDAATAGFRPVCLFGFEEGQNLFLDENGWEASYIPLAIRMKPFLIGVTSDETGEKRMEVHIDLDHPRVSSHGGEPLFLDHGGYAPLLQEVTSVLEEVHTGEQSVGIFAAQLDELGLIDASTLMISLMLFTICTVTIPGFPIMMSLLLHQHLQQQHLL